MFRAHIHVKWSNSVLLKGPRIYYDPIHESNWLLFTKVYLKTNKEAEYQRTCKTAAIAAATAAATTANGDTTRYTEMADADRPPHAARWPLRRSWPNSGTGVAGKPRPSNGAVKECMMEYTDTWKDWQFILSQCSICFDSIPDRLTHKITLELKSASIDSFVNIG